MRKMWRSKCDCPYEMLIPLIPVVLALGILEIYGPYGELLTGDELELLHATQVSFASGKLIFVAIAALHHFICIIAFFQFYALFRYVPKQIRYCYIVFSTLIILLAVLFTTPILHYLVPYESRYSELALHTLIKIYNIDVSCTNEDVRESVFSWMQFVSASTLPLVFALFPSTLFVALTNAQIRWFVYVKEYERGRICYICHQSLMQCLPMLSSIWISSAILSSIWFHMPANIYNTLRKSISEDILQKLQNYGDNMALLLGTIYTLIILIMVAWPIWWLKRKERAVGYAPKTGFVVDRQKTNYFWLMRQSLIVLAPLISTVLVNWLEELPGR